MVFRNILKISGPLSGSMARNTRRASNTQSYNKRMAKAMQEVQTKFGARAGKGGNVPNYEQRMRKAMEESRRKFGTGTSSSSSSSSSRSSSGGSSYGGGGQSFAPALQSIPTFGASYYIPQQAQRMMDQILGQKPRFNEAQLRKRAQTETDLFTNPQIETLREQINSFKTLIPETRSGLQETYLDATGQLSDSQQQLYHAALEEMDAQGGSRPGAQRAVYQQMRREARPLEESLRTDYRNISSQVLGDLENQKREARELLRNLERNKKNMTRDNYNALKDQAIVQFRQAQQAQRQFLNSIADLEFSARDTAARFQQESAAAHNEYLSQQSQLIGDMLAQQSDIQQLELTNNRLNNWLGRVTGPAVKGKREAYNFVQRNRNSIIEDLGPEVYEEILRYVEGLPDNWQNPNRYTPYTPSSRAAASTVPSAPAVTSSLPRTPHILKRTPMLGGF